MMYNNGLICVIKVGGKVLREQNGKVKLPFGSEYAIGLKNKQSKNVVISIEIDGEIKGSKFKLAPNQEIDLERPPTQGNSGKKFKFIEKTEQISDYRGDKLDDRLIVITYQFERIYDPIIINTPNNPWVKDDTYYDRWNRYYEPYCGDNTKICSNVKSSGITVNSSHSNQSFSYDNYIYLEDSKHNIIFELIGYNTIVTTKNKITCNICGTHNNSRNIYCIQCGNNIS